MDETDERISAWELIAKHPLFAKCYESESPLIQSMLDALDNLNEQLKAEAKTTQAEMPTEWRIFRAFANGYSEGLQRGVHGRLDH